MRILLRKFTKRGKRRLKKLKVIFEENKALKNNLAAIQMQIEEDKNKFNEKSLLIDILETTIVNKDKQIEMLEKELDKANKNVIKYSTLVVIVIPSYLLKAP